jgi:hypothetical protein
MSGLLVLVTVSASAEPRRGGRPSPLTVAERRVIEGLLGSEPAGKRCVHAGRTLEPGTAGVIGPLAGGPSLAFVLGVAPLELHPLVHAYVAGGPSRALDQLGVPADGRCGSVEMTTPIIDASGTRAIVYKAELRGYLNAEGALYFMSAKGKRWTVVLRIPLWIS